MKLGQESICHLWRAIRGISLVPSFRFSRIFWICSLPLIFMPFLFGQERVGLPFLKIIPGARQASMGGVAGMTDDLFALSLNPGGIGHLPHWEWAAGYTRWFLDIYQAHLAWACQFRFAGSRKTAIGAFMNSFGMPDWDATGGRKASVGASHRVYGITLGQRVDYLHPSLAIGMTVKRLSSDLGGYEADGWATDWGLLVRPNRFRLGKVGFGVFDYGLLGFGISLTHLGPTLRFDREKTALPVGWRAGGGVSLGRHGGWRLLVAADRLGSMRRRSTLAVGGELWYRDRLGFRAGYRFGGQDLAGLSFGFGLRFAPFFQSVLGLPTRFADAMTSDFAGEDYGTVLSPAYRGAFRHEPLAPEPFSLLNADEFLPEPLLQAPIEVGDGVARVLLSWERAEDPDPFDQVRYLLLIDQDPSQIRRAIHAVAYDLPAFRHSSLADSLDCIEDLLETRFVFIPSRGGVYYWAVVAYDLDDHTRVGRKGKATMASFMVALPDLVPTDIVFEPSRWITVGPEQGRLRITIHNAGTAPVDSFKVRIWEGPTDSSARARLLDERWIRSLPIKGDASFWIAWATDYRGRRAIRVEVDPDSALLESNRSNNRLIRWFHTIPKGEVLAPDTVEVMATGYDSTEVAVVPVVYFKAGSSEVRSEYIQGEYGIPGLLAILADRMRRHPEIVLTLKGFVDAQSESADPALADARAEAVRDTLIRLGVPGEQLVVTKGHPDRVRGKDIRGHDPQDRLWISEENRMVTLMARQEDEAVLFGPIPVAVDTTIRDSVCFSIRVEAASGIRRWDLGRDENQVFLADAPAVPVNRLWGDFYWRGTDRDRVVVPRNQWHVYRLMLVDTLGRVFTSPTDSIFLREKRTIRRKEVFGAAQFAKAEPVFQFYWDRLIRLAEDLIDHPEMHIRFEGHACAIGPEEVNERLSLRRAQYFTEGFLQRLRKAYPTHYESLLRRIDPPVGYGEREPLTIRLKGVGDLMLGDNRNPLGRYRNRRIAVLLYREN